MDCTGCNDGCFDESVQLNQGPTGPAGADGTNGTDGADGVAILYQSLAINSPTTIGNTFTDAVSQAIAGGTIADVGDTLSVEMIVMNENTWEDPTVPAGTEFYVEVLFGGSTMLSYKFGVGDANLVKNGAVIVLDLVVTAVNEITPRLNSLKEVWGFRSIQWYVSTKAATVGLSPSPDATGSSISATAITLTNSNDLKVRLKNSDNLSTSLASVTSMTVFKLLKS